MVRKKILCILTAGLMVLSIAGCGKKKDKDENTQSNNQNAAQNTTQDQGAGNNDAKTTESANGNQTAEAMIPGKLYYFTLDDRDSSVIRGVSFSGNRSGTSEYNSKKTATEGIRCIFELGEYVEPVVDTDAPNEISLYILKHNEDKKSYEAAEFSDLMNGFVYIHNMQKNEDNYWGEFYLNQDEVEPGYYDFVFVYEGKAIAAMVTYFYPMGDLEEKSDADLDKLISGLNP